MSPFGRPDAVRPMQYHTSSRSQLFLQVGTACCLKPFSRSVSATCKCEGRGQDPEIFGIQKLQAILRASGCQVEPLPGEAAFPISV